MAFYAWKVTVMVLNCLNELNFQCPTPRATVPTFGKSPSREWKWSPDNPPINCCDISKTPPPGAIFTSIIRSLATCILEIYDFSQALKGVILQQFDVGIGSKFFNVVPLIGLDMHCKLIKLQIE